MFSKNKISETPAPQPEPRTTPPANTSSSSSPASGSTEKSAPQGYPAKPKPSPSLLSQDLTVKGNVITSGDIQVEGTVEGDVRANLLTVGESALIKGEIVAEDVVVNGKVIGRVRGLKVRLTASARVEGDIVHKTIAIESGAHFEGSVQRQEDPLSENGKSSSSQSLTPGTPSSAPSKASGTSTGS